MRKVLKSENMQYQHFLLSLLIFPALASALWPFSENVKVENDNSAKQELEVLTNEEEDDPNSASLKESSYFNQCLDFYRCSVCYKIKQEGKCANYTNECRKTCTECKGPDSDHYGTVRCQFYKNKGYCDYFSFKSFKCQKTCGSCAVDGNWGKWSPWSACSKTCKQGKQSRQRLCSYPVPRYGGKKCEGPSSQEQICNENVPCPVDGMWGSWSQWSTCSKTCKQGQYSRTRKCDSPAAQYGGKKCVGHSTETDDCNKDVPCPVDGNWGEWTKWSTCSKTCKHGKQTRERKCNSPAPSYGGKKCVGESSGTKICNQNIPCPVAGNWGDWSQWSACSKTCKQGKYSRTRKCNSPAPQYGGKKCEGSAVDEGICNDNVPCPVDGNWGEWSKWGTCTKTCKQGKQSRTRICSSPAPQYGGNKCQGDSSEIQDCNKDVPCPIDGNWGKWSQWSACSKTCKQGKQSRQRLCNYPVPRYGGKKCEGPSSQEQICNENVLCPVDGNWEQWSKWSECTKTCKQGTQARKRECNSPAAQYGGKKCPGKSMQTQDCNKNVPCPVAGNWGDWSQWSTCSKTCKQGKYSRTRKCNSPAPQYGGKKCEGSAVDEGICNDNVPCPVDGNWGEWSKWGTCTKTCKQGKQSRTRICNSPAPQYGGNKCQGDSSEIQDCNKDVPCPIDGNWGKWSQWSACSKTCKQGKQSRQRLCNYPVPRYGGKKCEGPSSQEQICNDNVPCPVDGNWEQWSKWSECTKTCKQGTQARKRECNSPAAQYGGKKCPGKSMQTQDCNKNVPCPVNGNWAEWGAWTECSLTCGAGTQTRIRQCNNPAPAYGGKKCDGPFRQSGVCINRKCPVHGNWGGWSSWSECSKTCKQGQQWRSRKCNSPAPKYDGKPCAGEPTQIIYCNTNVPCPVDGMWGSWTAWSACSQTCGYGVRERKRYCDSPKPAYNGTTCVGDGYQKIRCHTYYPCPVNGNWTNWGHWTPCAKTCGSSYRKRSRSCTNPPPQYGGNGCDGKNDEVKLCTRPSCNIYG